MTVDVRCPYFCRDGWLLVWTTNDTETHRQACPYCRPAEPVGTR